MKRPKYKSRRKDFYRRKRRENKVMVYEYWQKNPPLEFMSLGKISPDIIHAARMYLYGQGILSPEYKAKILSINC